MADRPPDEVMDGVKQAIRVLTEHIGMSADSRRRIAIHLGDAVPDMGPPPDPKDVELAEMRAELNAMKAAQKSATVTYTTSQGLAAELALIPPASVVESVPATEAPPPEEVVDGG